jgi:hypothetical protein
LREKKHGSAEQEEPSAPPMEAVHTENKAVNRLKININFYNF